MATLADTSSDRRRDSQAGEIDLMKSSPPPEPMAQVLVAEDHQALQILYGTILREAGHEVYFADNGEQAMRLFLRHPIDVIVTDIQMPRGSGIELIAAVKGLYPDASIVAISGHGPEQLEVAKREGARTVLTKPIDRAVLLRAVDDATRPPNTVR